MYKYEFKLKQVTPMIHFQHNESGATLRSTEVKPKLDKFLWYCIQEKKDLPDIKELVKALEEEYKRNEIKQKSILLQHGEKKLPNSLLTANEEDKGAFRYQLRIEAKGNVIKSDTISAEKDTIDEKGSKNSDGKSKRVKPKNPINAMYFGNMVSTSGLSKEQKKRLVEKNFKETVFYQNALDCSIIADSPSLLALIKEILPAFFLLHNFGTRQTKGFGGFNVVDSEVDERNILKNYSRFSFLELKSDISPQKDLSGIDFKRKMELARGLYSLMKGGVNGRNNNSDYFKGYIFIYSFDLGLGNEKSFIKQNITHRDQARCLDKNIGNKKFVRALLGLTESYKFSSPIKVESLNKIQRYASPLMIKITEKSLFIIPRDSGKDIMGQNFKIGNLPISVPDEAFFKEKIAESCFIEDFIESFTYYFDGIKNETYDENCNSVALKNVDDNPNGHLKNLSRFTLVYIQNNKKGGDK